jgi:hypothetical protein
MRTPLLKHVVLVTYAVDVQSAASRDRLLWTLVVGLW